MEQHITELLQDRYPGATIQLETDTATQKIGGTIVSSEFEGMEFIDRQQELFDYLRAELGADAQLLTLIFTYTPEEVQAMEAA